MTRSTRGLVFGVLALVVTVRGVAAQAQKWATPYERGTKAVSAQKWAEAIPLLEQALAIEPTPMAQKPVEGVFKTDYFPQYYLFVAYLKTKQFDKARQFYNMKGPLPRNLLADSNKYYEELNAAQRDAANLPKFNDLVAKARDAFAKSSFDDSIKSYEEAKRLVPDEFNKQGLEPKLADARSGLKKEQDAVAAKVEAERARRVAEDKRLADAKAADEKRLADQKAAEQRAADQKLAEQRAADQKKQDLAKSLTAEGQKLAGDGKLAEAKQKFQAAQGQVAGYREAADGLADLQKREQDYAAAKGRGDQAAKSGNAALARDEYAKAERASPELFARDRLQGVVAGLEKQLGDQAIVDSAKKAFNEGRWADAASGAASALGRDPRNREMAALRDRAESRVAFDAARPLIAGGRYKDAEAKLGESKAKDPSNKEAVSELARVQQLIAQQQQQQLAAQQQQQQQQQQLQRQQEPKQPDVVQAGQSLGPSDASARDGLLALFNGNLQEAIAKLEQAVKAAPKTDKSRLAVLYAYLGVAYATSSFQSSDQASEQLKSKALGEFQSALALERGYRLSERLVSPRVLELFDRARSGSNH